jgi:zinc protease
MVRRGDPDYAALLLAQTYLGQHRTGGRLYDRIREVRGLNYGDYAYIEHFPRGMFTMEPPSNIARRSQIFQIWIRPVEPEAAAFALKLAHYELHKLIHDGIPEDAFERTKENLSKFADVLTRTRQAQLGYAIDSMYYRMPPYATYLKQALAKLTRQEVNVVIRRWLRANRIQFVAVTGDPEGLAAQLTSGQTVKITYNSPKPADVVAEDKIVSNWDIGLRKEDIEIVPVERVFE